MVDVDYYLDDFSRFANNPIMIYTAIPDRISGTYKGTTYRYTGPSTYEETVAGGAKYVSSLWDYSPDLVRVDRKFWGIPIGFTIMKVEKIAQPDTANRFLVSLVPKVRSCLPYWLHRAVVWITGMSYAYGTVDPLQRVNNVQEVGQYLVGRFAPYDRNPERPPTPIESVHIRPRDSSTPERIEVPEELF
jgi:hypothetical protein